MRARPLSITLSPWSLTNCAQTYFAQSEQLPTRFHGCWRSQAPGEAESWRAGGDASAHAQGVSFAAGGEGTGDGGLLAAEDILDGDEGENPNRVNLLLDTVEELEMVGSSVQLTELLMRLFHEEEPRMMLSVKFGCTCSADRVRQSCRSIGQGHRHDDPGRWDRHSGLPPLRSSLQL